MSGLIDLRISVYEQYPLSYPSCEQELLTPLMQVYARNFVVRLPHKLDSSATEDFLRAPFTVERAPLIRHGEREELGNSVVEYPNYGFHPRGWLVRGVSLLERLTDLMIR